MKPLSQTRADDRERERDMGFKRLPPNSSASSAATHDADEGYPRAACAVTMSSRSLALISPEASAS